MAGSVITPTRCRHSYLLSCVSTNFLMCKGGSFLSRLLMNLRIPTRSVPGPPEAKPGLLQWSGVSCREPETLRDGHYPGRYDVTRRTH